MKYNDFITTNSHHQEVIDIGNDDDEVEDIHEQINQINILEREEESSGMILPSFHKSHMFNLTIDDDLAMEKLKKTVRTSR